ncbi:MAG: hypothetical protein ACRC1V_04875, partial [Plesiomonas sp.]
MGNQIFIPKLNPLKWVDVGAVANPKYHSKHLENYFFSDRRQPWQQRECHCQVWQTTDIINLQFSSNFAPVVVQLIDGYGNVVSSAVAVNSYPFRNSPGWNAYEVSFSLAGLSTGGYLAKMLLGTGVGAKVLQSNTFFV